MKNSLNVFTLLTALTMSVNAAAQAESAKPFDGSQPRAAKLTITPELTITPTMRAYDGEFGPGLITDTYANDTARFVIDGWTGVQPKAIIMDKAMLAKLLPHVDCPQFEKKAVFSTSEVTAVPLMGGKPFKVPRGLGGVQENFGTCSTGMAKFKQPYERAVIVSTSTLLPEVECGMTNRRAYSNAVKDVDLYDMEGPVGMGVVKKVYGSCADGVATFHADRFPTRDKVIYGNTIVGIKGKLDTDSPRPSIEASGGTVQIQKLNSTRR